MMPVAPIMPPAMPRMPSGGPSGAAPPAAGAGPSYAPRAKKKGAAALEDDELFALDISGGAVHAALWDSEKHAPKMLPLEPRKKDAKDAADADASCPACVAFERTPEARDALRAWLALPARERGTRLPKGCAVGRAALALAGAKGQSVVRAPARLLGARVDIWFNHLRRPSSHSIPSS